MGLFPVDIGILYVVTLAFGLIAIVGFVYLLCFWLVTFNLLVICFGLLLVVFIGLPGDIVCWTCLVALLFVFVFRCGFCNSN